MNIEKLCDNQLLDEWKEESSKDERQRLKSSATILIISFLAYALTAPGREV